jgi:hypothetical protein
VLLFRNDLQQYAARDLGVGFLVDDDEVYFLDNQPLNLRQGDVAAFHGVV